MKMNSSLGAYKTHQYIDFDDEAEIADLKIGDTVKIILSGKVVSLTAKESDEDPKKTVSSLCLEDAEAEVVPQGTQFDSLLDDD